MMGRGRGGLRREGHLHRDRGHKAVALPVQSMDAARRASRLPQRLAQRLHTGFQRLVPDKLLRPQLLQEFLPGNHALTMRQKVSEHLKDFASQFDGSPCALQLMALGVQGIVAKGVAHCLALLSAAVPSAPSTSWGNSAPRCPYIPS
jgi:hypothetical protein